MWSGIQRKDNMRIKRASSELSSGTSLMEEYPPYFVQSPSERSSSIHRSSRSGWEKIDLELEEKEDEEEEHRENGDEFDYDDEGWSKWRSYVAVVRFVARAVAVFVVAFTFVAVVLWGASRGYKPRVVVQEMVFKDLSIWPGQDRTGVPTEMMSLKSKVKILYGKPATFFGVHVSSTLILHHHGLELATGRMVKLYQSKKREEKITTVVIHGDRMPLYGALLALKRATVGDMIDKHKVKIGLNLTFTMRTRANILGKLVKLKLFTTIVCPVTLDGARLRVPINLTHSCIYQ